MESIRLEEEEEREEGRREKQRSIRVQEQRRGKEREGERNKISPTLQVNQRRNRPMGPKSTSASTGEGDQPGSSTGTKKLQKSIKLIQ